MKLPTDGGLSCDLPSLSTVSVMILCPFAKMCQESIHGVFPMHPQACTWWWKHWGMSVPAEAPPMGPWLRGDQEMDLGGAMKGRRAASTGTRAGYGAWIPTQAPGSLGQGTNFRTRFYFCKKKSLQDLLILQILIYLHNILHITCTLHTDMVNTCNTNIVYRYIYTCIYTWVMNIF